MLPEPPGLKRDAHDPSAHSRILVRIRLDLFLSLCTMRVEKAAQAAGSSSCGAPSCSGRCSRPKGGRPSPFALHPEQGPLHVARHGARGRPARAALLPSQNLSPERCPRRAHRARWGPIAAGRPPSPGPSIRPSSAECRDISDPQVLSPILTDLGPMPRRSSRRR